MVPKIYMTNKVNIFDVQIMKLRGLWDTKSAGTPWYQLPFTMVRNLPSILFNRFHLFLF